jgi:tRNA 2-selenouridine synthase
MNDRSAISDRNVISAADAVRDLAAFGDIIDVRSPGEFAQDHLPGAINAPVLDDAQRAEVGTLDRQHSSFEARRRGAAYVARNIARHLEQAFSERPRDWRPLVYCWRGGNRSGAMTHILGGVGWQARQLEGGYRAFRGIVLGELDLLPARFSLRVVCGPTGSGKSRLLQQLAGVGAQVLDLEAIAHHRGSVLGGLPAMPQPSQKLFETRVWDRLRGFDPGQPVYVESESRKVGEVRVPDALLAHMRAAECVRIELPLDARVRLLRDEYAHFEDDPATLFAQLDCLTPMHGRERVDAWKTLAAERQWDQMVAALLSDHYDPAYGKSMTRNFARAALAPVISISSDETGAFATAARALAAA